MRILAVHAEDYPWDIRIDKLLSGFAQQGHSVALVCRNLQRRPQQSTVGSIRCYRVPAPKYRPAVGSTMSIPAFFSPVWASAISNALRQENADVLLIRNLPLSPLGIRLGKKHRLPVVLDLAENHPALWRNVCKDDPLKIPSWLLKNPWLAKRMESYVAGRADAIIVVVEEMIEVMVRAGANRRLIHVVSNTPELSFLSGAPTAEAGLSPKEASDFELVYVGFITKRRGLDQVLQALAILSTRGLQPHFHIVGDGSYIRVLERNAERMGIANQVTFHGWVDHERLPAILSNCDLGVIPHRKNEHTDSTIPNKVFDYMARGLPVLVANLEPLARLITEVGCGLVFADGSPEDLAAQISKLGDQQRRLEYGDAGRRAVKERFNWQQDFAIADSVLQSVVRDFAKARQP